MEDKFKAEKATTLEKSQETVSRPEVAKPTPSVERLKVKDQAVASRTESAAVSIESSSTERGKLLPSYDEQGRVNSVEGRLSSAKEDRDPPSPNIADRPTFGDLSKFVSGSRESFNRDVDGKVAAFYSGTYRPEQVHDSYRESLPAGEFHSREFADQLKANNPARTVTIHDTEVGKKLDQMEREKWFEPDQRHQLWQQASENFAAAASTHAIASIGAVSNARPERTYSERERPQFDGNTRHTHITDDKLTEPEYRDGEIFIAKLGKNDKLPHNYPTTPDGKVHVS